MEYSAIKKYCLRTAKCMAVICLVLLGNACGNDTVGLETEKSVTILKSDLLFEPLGRTGFVEVQAQGVVTAELQSDWCSASVEGNMVSVTVEDNGSFEGRTALLTISADGAQVQLPVQQRGMALGSLPKNNDHIGNAGGRLSYYIRHDLPFNLTTEDEWIHATMDGDSLHVDIDRNADVRLRRGVLEYECAGYTGQLDIVQYDLDTILGDWYLGGSMGGAPTGFRFWLKRDGTQYYMTIYRLEEWVNSRIPVGFDEDRCELTLYNASLIQDDGNSVYAFYFYGPNGVATSPDATMKARFYYNPYATSTTGSHYATLEDGGTWGDGSLSGFLINLNITMLNQNITFVQLDNPYLVWMGRETN